MVFETLTARGENVHDLIENKRAETEGMSYDKASREVVAEAMTDILPDANFAQELAEKHRNIFDKLIEKLKEFVADLKAYFATIKGSPAARETKALKEQVGESVRYMENIVKLFDRGTVGAVENYQATVATEEADINGLTDDEKGALMTYKSGGSYNLNAKLRDGMQLSEDVWARAMSEARTFRDKAFAKYKYDAWDFNKRFEFTSTTGLQFSLSLGQIMSLYAYSKREQAGDHLQKGGFVFDGKTKVKKKSKLGVEITYRLKDPTAYKLSEKILKDILKKLDMFPGAREFVDEMQEYLSGTMAENGNEVSLALYGVKLFREKHYFPLRSAKQYLERAREQAQGEVKIKNSGFTKETKPHADNPIVLSSFMDVWANHVNEMSMYHAFTLPLEDFYKRFLCSIILLIPPHQRGF